MPTKHKFKKFLLKAIPLSVYLESITAICITKGVSNITDLRPLTSALYYVYIATIYLVQVLKVLLTKFLHG